MVANFSIITLPADSTSFGSTKFVSRGFAMRKAIAVFGLALLSLVASYAIVSIWPHDSPREAVQDDEASKISP